MENVGGVDLYRAVGGATACRNLAEAFYGRVKQDPVLRPLFPGKSLRCAIEAFSAFLAQFLGGPAEEAQHRWWLSLHESHQRFEIGPAERDAWMKHMALALDEVSIEETARAALRAFFERSSAYLVNTRPLPAVPQPERPGSDIHRAISQRWKAQRALDECVAAIRRGDANGAIVLAEGPDLQAHFKGNRSVFAALLASMIGADRALLDYVRGKLEGDPALAMERYSGRALIHAAAAAGNSSLVELLLRLGSDPNVATDGGRTPLFCLANECRLDRGARTVRALLQAGAQINARDNVKRCTPLHMAARRGNVEIAQALLDCGADIEARDSLGETPLRRAVNCNQVDVAALLLAKGADVHSKGSKNLTPLTAARTAAMRQILQPL